MGGPATPPDGRRPRWSKDADKYLLPHEKPPVVATRRHWAVLVVPVAKALPALVVGLALVGQHLDHADDRERVVAHQHLLAVPRVARGARAIGQPHPLGRERGWQHYLPPFFLRLALARRWARLSAWT